MRELVAQADWPFTPRSTRPIRPGHVRRDLLDLFEAATGIRVGDYRNFKLI
jgi:hypothetical protein